MSDKIRVRVTREYEIDYQAWAEEYNLSGDFDEAVADVGSSLQAAAPHPTEPDFPAYHHEFSIVRQTDRKVEFL